MAAEAGGGSQHALGRVCLPGGVCPGEVSAWGSSTGGCLIGGVSAGGDVCHTAPPLRSVKILPCRNYVADGNN